MRGIILWIAVGIAAIATGLGLYATALRTSPASVTSPPADIGPAPASSPLPQPAFEPQPDRPGTGLPDDGHARPDDHGGTSEHDD